MPIDASKKKLSYFCPKAYSWIVQKQYNFNGKSEYMIEVVELEGCVSYGETLAEAKQGLTEAIQLWLKHHGVAQPLVTSRKTHLVHLEPKMTKVEFQKINRRLLKLLN